MQVKVYTPRIVEIASEYLPALAKRAADSLGDRAGDVSATRGHLVRQAVQDENDGDHDHHEADHHPRERTDAAVETRFNVLSNQALGHAAEIGLGAGGDHDGPGRAAFDARAQVARIG